MEGLNFEKEQSRLPEIISQPSASSSALLDFWHSLAFCSGGRLTSLFGPMVDAPDLTKVYTVLSELSRITFQTR